MAKKNKQTNKQCFEDNQQNEPPKKIYSWNKF